MTSFAKFHRIVEKLPECRAVLKPNLVTARLHDGLACTHPEFVAAVAEWFLDHGAKVSVGDSPAFGTAKGVMAACAITSALKKLPVKFVDFDKPVSVSLPSDFTVGIDRTALETDMLINLPKLKTHAQMYLTLGVKNLFGCIPGKRKLQWHLAAGDDTAAFASMLLDLHDLLGPRLTVIDGVVAMEGNGPGSGDPRSLGLILASKDAIALDGTIAEILGARPEDLPVLRVAAARAEAAGLEPTETIVKGEPVADVKVEGFRFPPLVSVDFAAVLPYFIGKRVKKALTSRPHVDAEACALCNVCVSICPAVAMERQNRIVIDYDRCIRCYCCQESCPRGAITAREGWLKRLIPGL